MGDIKVDNIHIPYGHISKQAGKSGYIGQSWAQDGEATLPYGVDGVGEYNGSADLRSTHTGITKVYVPTEVGLGQNFLFRL